MDLHVRIVHAKKLNSRRSTCDELITRLKQSGEFRSIDATLVETSDPDTLNIADVKSLVKLEKTKDPVFDGYVKNLHINQVSNILKHHRAIVELNEIAQTKPPTDQSAYIITEDDAIFKENVPQSLATALKKAADQPYDIIILGLQDLVLPQVSEFVPWSVQSGVFKSTVAYALTRQGLQRLTSKVQVLQENGMITLEDAFFPIRFAYHVQLAYIAHKANLRVATYTPGIFTDGSKFGTYISTLTATNPLVFNPDYVKFSEYVNRPDPYTDEELKEVVSIFNRIRFKNHPDMMHLFVLHEMKMKNYTKAASLCKDTYNILMQHGGLLTNESSFLRTFIQLHKYLQ